MFCRQKSVLAGMMGPRRTTWPVWLFISALIPSECQQSCKYTHSHKVMWSDEATYLPCSVKSAYQQQYRVKWTKVQPDGSSRKIIAAWPESPKPVVQRDPRVFLMPGRGGVETGDASLILQNITSGDSGNYSCEVWVVWSCLLNASFTLNVKECGWATAVKALQNSTVTLTCPVRTGTESGITEVIWEAIEGKQPVRIARHPYLATDNVSVAAAFVNKATVHPSNTSLTLNNMDENDYKWYKCTLRTDEEQYCYEINLKVRDLTAQSTRAALREIHHTSGPTSQVSPTWTSPDQTSVQAETASVLFSSVTATAVCVCVFVAVGIALHYKCRHNKKEQVAHWSSIDPEMYYSDIETENPVMNDNSLYTPASGSNSSYTPASQNIWTFQK
ncbi:uncharacterized protein LOC114791080 isoform X2 [Denticeps clupeoides]|uniref:uncharacterized protein LOC114791080 isoform X2 n=1 Tax=Denticeps clupeoides TaxID=299321 RepID=UPI0010A2BEE9|nr:uncharacterized protein LOC114791080 isoform X2 [Denticeps clupeoides]